MDSSGGRELAASIATFAMAGFLWWSNRSLDVGTAAEMGPGYAPMLISILLCVCGAILLLRAASYGWAALPKAADFVWLDIYRSVKTLVLVLGAIVLFSLLIRTAGLALTAFISAVIVSRAADDMKWTQSFIVGASLAVFSVLLFSYLLNLPMPVIPPSWN